MRLKLLVIAFFLAFGVMIQAQTPVELSSLTVELWPEFDRPDVLVIYRAQLAENAALPATVTFQLPGYIETPHAVAYEENGRLLDIPQENIEISQDGDTLRLTLTSPSPNIHLEYYDSQILTRQDDTRQINYIFTPNFNTQTAVFQIQQPLETQDFQLTPPASDTFTDRNGFSYQVITAENLAPNDTFQLVASYTRPIDVPSAELIRNTTPEHAADIQVVTDNPPAEGEGSLYLGYALIGLGVALILGAIGYWFWNNKIKSQDQPARRSPRSPASRPAKNAKQKATPQPQQTSPAPQTGSVGYCYRCGTALRPDSNFCHACGAERRQE